jgi:hypothetical protein
MKKSETATSVATTLASTVVAQKDLDARAAYVGVGSEGVTASDMAIPRLKLLQMINDEVQPGGAKQIEGATAGMIMNSVSNELHSGLFVVNLNFSKKIVVWRKRKSGGGMQGTYETEAEARTALIDAGLNEADHDVSENPTHLVMIIDGTGKPKGVALLDMPGTKIKVSKKWNSLIAEQEEVGNPRFSCVWELKIQSESNNSGNYFNYDVGFVANAPEEIYAAATNAYETFFGTAKAKAA